MKRGKYDFAMDEKMDMMKAEKEISPDLGVLVSPAVPTAGEFRASVIWVYRVEVIDVCIPP